ncbi:PQQ-binding-like beta-propeller repeat protein, partial [Micromonospora zhanjiangensis]
MRLVDGADPPDATESAPALRDERVQWSIDLPPADDGHLLVTPDGRVVVSTRRFLAVVHPSGRPGWLVRTDLGLLGEPVLLAGDKVLRDEDGNLVTRDLTTGATTVSIAVPGVSGMAAGPDGDLLHSAWIQDRGPMLCRSAPDGPVRWAVPLTEPFVTLLATRDRVLVADGGSVRAYDLAGTALWSADRDGFREPDAPTPTDGRVHGPLRALPDGRILVEFAEPDGHGFYLLDPAAATVDRLAAP